MGWLRKSHQCYIISKAVQKKRTHWFRVIRELFGCYNNKYNNSEWL